MTVRIQEFLIENISSKTRADGSFSQAQLEKLLIFMGQLYQWEIFAVYEIHLAIVILLKGFIHKFSQDDKRLFGIILRGLYVLCKSLVEFHSKKMRPIPKPVEHSYFVKNFSETIRSINSKSQVQSLLKISNLTCNCMVDLLDEMLEM